MYIPSLHFSVDQKFYTLFSWESEPTIVNSDALVNMYWRLLRLVILRTHG